MKEALYLASRYLAANKLTTAVLLVSMTLILYLPAGLFALVRDSARSLTERSEQTPLVVGAKGSPLELTLNTLYFDAAPPEELPYSEAERIVQSGFATPIPILAAFQSRGHRIVGTTPDYLEVRGLTVARGRSFAILGECVVGSRVAEALGLEVGGSVISSPESVFDLAGVYPLKMTVVGILAPTATPDDRAIFTDVKTTWIIAGKMHGHQDLRTREAVSGVLRREEDRIVANASVMQFNEITPDNIGSFHLHGERGDLPLTAVIAVPPDPKSAALLQGRYLAKDESAQIVNPAVVMGELLETILTLRTYAVAALSIACLAAAATSALVFLLSLRLRRREIATLHKIGTPKGRVFAILASEILLILVSSALIATGLTILTARFGEAAIRSVLGA